MCIKRHDNLKASLSPEQAAVLGGAGSPGAASFLAYPSEPSCSMEDPIWSTALRQRLAMPRAECSRTQLTHAAPHCCLRSGDGSGCGQVLDANGFHALTDQRGGNVLARHECLNSAIGGLILQWRAVIALYNQRVPHWDRPSRRPGQEGTRGDG